MPVRKYGFMKWLFCLCLLGVSLAYSQAVKEYDENGMLRSVIPLNKKGVFEGMGYVFYPNGAKEKESPYVAGEIHGIQKEYYEKGQLKAKAKFEHGKQTGLYHVYFPDSSLKMVQEWRNGRRNGKMEVFYPQGQLRIFALFRNDSIQFAQNFDEDGKLVSEKLGYISQELDTTDLPKARTFFEVGSSLRSNVSSRVQIAQPKIPSSFITFTSPNGAIEVSKDELFPLIVTPKTEKKNLIYTC